MITLRRLGHSDEPFQLNPDMIVTVESTPDTVLALATGVKVVVVETPEEVAEEVRTYRAEVLGDAMRKRRPERAPRAGTSSQSARGDGPHLTAVEDPAVPPTA